MPGWVAPLVGAWIEIQSKFHNFSYLSSLLLWERGLKLGRLVEALVVIVVAPLVGAWIEIVIQDRENHRVGSLLLWERGLKYRTQVFALLQSGRSSCGSVD